MSIKDEILAKIRAGTGLTPEEKNSAAGFVMLAQENAANTHRLSAFGDIDRLLESGQITPEEAERRKRNWDLRHP